MLKNTIKSSLLIAAIITLSACGGSSCSTAEDVKAKGEELAEKFQELATSGDMSKVMALAGKMKNLQNIGNNSDPQAACDAMDELMDEL